MRSTRRRPCKNWDLPEVFQHLRHLLEARMGNKGKREFIQVLRLLEAMPREVVTYAVTEAIHLGAIGFDAVKLIAAYDPERMVAQPLPSPTVAYLIGSDALTAKETPT